MIEYDPRNIALKKMPEQIVNGIPVLVSGRERVPRTVRIRVKKRKKFNARSIERLPEKHRKAFKNLLAMGIQRKKEAAMKAGFSESHAVRVIDNMIIGRKELLDELEKQGATQERLAEVMVEGLDATHPMSKEDKKDYKAIVKFVSEINKIKDNYPPKKISSEEKIININLSKDDLIALEEYKRLRQQE